ncbi:MAG TPA: hypothetical protein VGH98_06315 [Gemmatimonadaceae bacterium]|jgi:hypothetical protein
MVGCRSISKLWFIGLASCTAISGEHTCTLIGCDSGLVVHLATMPTAPFRVEVRISPGDQAAYVFDCTDLTRCSQDVFLNGLIADRATVTVIVGAASSTTTFNQIVYTTSQPNGPDCEPTCKQGTVQVSIPT